MDQANGGRPQRTVNRDHESNNDEEYREGNNASSEGRRDESNPHCGDVSSILNDLAPYIKELHRPARCPHLALEPMDHQHRALDMIERSRHGPLKMIMIADPPGLGKTMISMMAIVKAIASAKRFSIVVAPSSCLQQWKDEFERCFVPVRFLIPSRRLHIQRDKWNGLSDADQFQGAVRVLIAQDYIISPREMLKYDVIILSYAFVTSTWRKREKLARINTFLERGDALLSSNGSNLSIFSEFFHSEFIRDGSKSPYLVLDEANAIESEQNLAECAVVKLRRLCETCVILKGNPFDDFWSSVSPILHMAGNQGIEINNEMIHLLGYPDENPKEPPTGQRLRRSVQILNSFMVRRPGSIIKLPPLEQETVYFELEETERNASSAMFEIYQEIFDDASQPKSLTRALQHAYHPKLVQITDLINDENYVTAYGTEDDDDFCSGERFGIWHAWTETLKRKNNWHSSRVQALMDVFNRCRDLDQYCSVIIFDESAYFLDIVEVAFDKMNDDDDDGEQVGCFRYDGRHRQENRAVVLDDFKRYQSSKVLLTTRGAGGAGLNLTCASVVIQCGPWWSKGWEEKAMKRVWRQGQTNPVTYIQLVAQNCDAEQYVMNVRDKKHELNSTLLDAITRKDDEEVQVWNTFG